MENDENAPAGKIKVENIYKMNLPHVEIQYMFNRRENNRRQLMLNVEHGEEKRLCKGRD